MIVDQIFAAGETSLKDPAAWLLEALGGRKTASGERVTTTTAMALPAYYAALRAISEDVGKLPLKIYERLKPRGKAERPDHRLYSLLHDSPNQDMSAMTFRETLTQWALAWGGGPAEIIRDGRNDVVELYPIHPNRITLQRDKATRQLFYKVKADDILLSRTDPVAVLLPARDVFHLRGLGSGLLGYSILQFASESLGLGLAAQKFGAAFFGNSAMVGGVLEHPKVLSAEAGKRLRESWSEEYVGSDKVGKTLIAEEGMKFVPRAIPPEQAQFLQTRHFQIEDVARWFRIPPHKLQHLLRATFSNIEEQSIEYVTDTLDPWLIRWEQEIARKLISDAERETIFAEHVVAALLRGDQKKRGEFYNKQFQVGALSPNDIRELENRNPIGPEGDQYFVPGNMMPIPEPGATDEQPSEPSPPPQIPPENATEFQMIVWKPAFVTVASRLVDKEIKAIGKAGSRLAGEGDKFALWIRKFYAAHSEQLFESLLPIAIGFARSVVGREITIPERTAIRNCVSGRIALMTDAATARFEMEFTKLRVNCIVPVANHKAMTVAILSTTLISDIAQLLDPEAQEPESWQLPKP